MGYSASCLPFFLHARLVSAADLGTSFRHAVRCILDIKNWSQFAATSDATEHPYLVQAGRAEGKIPHIASAEKHRCHEILQAGKPESVDRTKQSTESCHSSALK